MSKAEKTALLALPISLLLAAGLAWSGSQGGKVVAGGKRHAMGGSFFEPTVIADAKPRMRFTKDEIFGPIACVIRVPDYETALATLNDTQYGLTAGIITNSLKIASDFKARAQTGCVMVNLPTAGTDYHVPFGGRKASSFGPREQGRYAREFYTIVKTCYIKA